MCKCGEMTRTFQVHLWAKNQKVIVQLTVYENTCTSLSLYDRMLLVNTRIYQILPLRVAFYRELASSLSNSIGTFPMLF